VFLDDAVFIEESDLDMRKKKKERMRNGMKNKMWKRKRKRRKDWTLWHVAKEKKTHEKVTMTHFPSTASWGRSHMYP
jgi:hypothetical protein